MNKSKKEPFWKLAQARFTIFPISPIEYSSFDWWKELLNEKPDNRTELPRDGRLSEKGTFASKKLRLNIEPIRVNWFFEPSDEDASKSFELPIIGEWPEDVYVFIKLMKTWSELNSVPKFRRFAFGAILSHPVKDLKEGYEKLNEYLSTVELDPENSSDFFYQINRPRPKSSVLPEVSVNRLSKWSVSRFESGLISTEQISTVKKETFFACRLELDINTDRDYDRELGKIEMLYDEFLNLAIEISQRGDIK